jgi:hypothetical protein
MLPYEERRLQIEHRWPRHRWDARGRSRWESWEWSQYLLIMIFVFLTSAALVDTALSKDGNKEPLWPFGLLAENPVGLSVVALLIIVNGWLTDRSLADRTSTESSIPHWLRWSRRIIVTLPILGLYMIPVWRWRVRNRSHSEYHGAPRLEIPAAPESCTLTSTLSARIDGFRRTGGQSLFGVILWLIAGQIAPWLALLSWITTADSLSPERRATLHGICLLLQGMACALALQFGILRRRQIRASHWRAGLLMGAPLLFLLPFPFSALSMLPWIAAAGVSRTEETLVGQICSLQTISPIRTAFARQSRDRLFKDSRFSRWASSLRELVRNTGERSETTQRRFAFQRLKNFLLLFDASALAWFLARSGHPLLSLQTPSLFPITPTLIAAVVTAALGLLIEAVFLVVRLNAWHRRTLFPDYPLGRSIAFTQLALASGLALGGLLAAGGMEKTLGQLLFIIGFGAILGITLFFALGSSLVALSGQELPQGVAWTGLFCEFSAAGAMLWAFPELSLPVRRFFGAAIQLTPLWSFALFLGLGRWLLHPFSLRHLFEKRLPGRARAVLAAIYLTAALPLGGIAIPFWVYAHHRLWPRYEPLLWELEQSNRGS